MIIMIKMIKIFHTTVNYINFKNIIINRNLQKFLSFLSFLS
jgi:hypothetical protein